MDKKIVKTVIVFVIIIISSLVTPIIAQLYQQQTGIEPIAFQGVVIFGSIGVSTLILFNLWNENI